MNDIECVKYKAKIINKHKSVKIELFQKKNIDVKLYTESKI